MDGLSRVTDVPVNYTLLTISLPVSLQACSLETKTSKQGRMCVQRLCSGFLLEGCCVFTVAGQVGGGAEKVWVSEAWTLASSQLLMSSRGTLAKHFIILGFCILARQIGTSLQYSHFPPAWTVYFYFTLFFFPFHFPNEKTKQEC